MTSSSSIQEVDGVIVDSTVIDDDPYIWLEDVESNESLQFAKDANDACLSALGNPNDTDAYTRILDVLESKDRIPHVTLYGYNNDGESILMNFWKDSEHPKGIWRYTSYESYRTTNPNWITTLDIDQLAINDNKSWVYKGNNPLSRSRDDITICNKKRVSRTLIQLSNGGSDAIYIKEFDLLTNTFVESDAFHIPIEGKSRINYKSRNICYVGTTHLGNVTDSGYPRTIREWIRGTDLNNAPIIHQGEITDVSVGMYIVDERIWNGNLYEIKYRSMTFYTSKYWIRRITDEDLVLPSVDNDANPFIPLDIQDDAQIDFVGQMIFITLRSDWNPCNDIIYPKGSVIYTDIETFITIGCSACQYHILFQPTSKTSYSGYTLTKDYMIMYTMDDVKEKLYFYKINPNGTSIELINGPSSQQQGQPLPIRSCSCIPIDPYSGSNEFFFTTSDYTTPSTLYKADVSKMIESNEDDMTDKDPFIVEKLKSLPSQYDSTNYITEQHFAISLDGTSVPYFIIRPKDIIYDGYNPTLLYGYGGFEVSLGPKYIASTGIVWLERNPKSAVYVEANIRGGGEYGPQWHQSALQSNRNKAYEDFIAIAEDLIKRNICSSQTLAIRGGSNGGLLVANMYTMRPDLFGAIHCAVPLIDMKRFHKLLAGASWMAEYGNPDTDDWEFLQKYSPYHNIDPNDNYPPILITTSTRDDRVHPAHARKFVKKLWDVGNGKWTVHYYENIEGGHGGAADAKQSAFMTVLAYNFMYETISKNIEILRNKISNT